MGTYTMENTRDCITMTEGSSISMGTAADMDMA